MGTRQFCPEESEVAIRMQHVSRSLWGHLHSLLNKGRKRQDDHLLEQIRNVLWHSIPVVYPYWERDILSHQREYDKLRKRKGRWLRYVSEMSATFNSLYLLSLTFTDDCLSSTSSDTRQRYVRRWLNDNTVDYFACVDYGLENGREHYHAIVSFSPQGTAAYAVAPVPLTPIHIGRGTFYRIADPSREWPYGFYSIRAVRSDPASQLKTAFYALKSASYSFKSAKEDGIAKPFHKRGAIHFADLPRDIDF